MKNQSYYNGTPSTEDLNITYYLGAGASFNAIPIWKEQGQSMIDLADQLLFEISEKGHISTFANNEFFNLLNNKDLIEVFNKIKKYGTYATEYGSIDIYAKKLYLTNNITELNELKFSLSVYLDIWESGLIKFLKKNNKNWFEDNSTEFYNNEIVDKRYYSLFSVLLEKTKSNPKLNENIKFLSWNYDLQLETAFESFLPKKIDSYQNLNNYINFLSTQTEKDKRDIVHLNGHRGMFTYGQEVYETVPKNKIDILYNYLNILLSTLRDFKSHNRSIDYSNFINYGWESKKDNMQYAKSVLKNTNILIIIGYSFPAFNRKIDSELIEEFENNELEFKKVIYQDPNANSDIIKSIFRNHEDVQIEIENKNQFYIPHEFLFAKPGSFIVVE